MGFSSERKLLLRAPPCGGRVPTKKMRPRSIVFSPRLARALVSLSCESACRPHAGAVCVQKFLSRVRSRSVSYPGLPAWRNKPGCFTPGLSANQRRLNWVLSSCTVAKSPSCMWPSVFLCFDSNFTFPVLINRPISRLFRPLLSSSVFAATSTAADAAW